MSLAAHMNSPLQVVSTSSFPTDFTESWMALPGLTRAVNSLNVLLSLSKIEGGIN